MSGLALIILISLVSGLVVTPLVRRAAIRLQFIDCPDGNHKRHTRVVPLGGGIAVFVALLAGVLGAFLIKSPWQATMIERGGELAALAVAALIVVVVGIIDDRFSIRGRHKLAGQIVAVGVIVGSGLVVSNLRVFEFNLTLGLLAIPFTMFWLLGAINALNLIDGIDGLATTVGLILTVTIATLAILTGKPFVAIIGLAFAGALLGFLPYNFPPARMFLGDTGSMLIGLVVGYLAIAGSLKGPATVTLAAPMAVWAIPIFDSVAAILRRRLTGRSLYATDRGHLHHRLMALLGSNTRVLALVALCCTATCLGAMASVFLRNDALALISMLAVIAILIVSQVFGHVEAQLVANRVRSAGSAWLRLGRTNGKVQQSQVRLQGSRQWERLWETLTECAEKLNLHYLDLDVNLPAAQEGFHANWRRPTETERTNLWRTELPFFAAGFKIAHLTVIGEANGETPCELIGRLVDLLAPFESQLVAATDGLSGSDHSAHELTTPQPAPFSMAARSA